MSRTTRKLRPSVGLGEHFKDKQCKCGGLRDGTVQKASRSCESHGGCPYCESNRNHRHKKKMCLVGT